MPEAKEAMELDIPKEERISHTWEVGSMCL